MDGERFDAWTRRRAMLGIGGLAMGLLGMAGPGDASAKKGKGKKKKKKMKGPSFACNNPGLQCGSGAGCACLETTENNVRCARPIADAEACQTSRDCPTGQFCLSGGGGCVAGCRTG